MDERYQIRKIGNGLIVTVTLHKTYENKLLEEFYSADLSDCFAKLKNYEAEKEKKEKEEREKKQNAVKG